MYILDIQILNMSLSLHLLEGHRLLIQCYHLIAMSIKDEQTCPRSLTDSFHMID
jgi:hypothetical protein